MGGFQKGSQYTQCGLRLQLSASARTFEGIIQMGPDLNVDGDNWRGRNWFCGEEEVEMISWPLDFRVSSEPNVDVNSGHSVKGHDLGLVSS